MCGSERTWVWLSGCVAEEARVQALLSKPGGRSSWDQQWLVLARRLAGLVLWTEAGATMGACSG